MFKKSFSLLLMMVIGLSCLFTTPLFADDLTIDSADEIEVNSYKEDTLPVISEDSKIVTRDEAIELLMDNKGMSFGEADEVLKDSRVNQNKLSPLYRSSSSDNKNIVYVNRTKTYDAGSGAKIEIGALLEVEISYTWGTKRILSTKEKWITMKGDNTSTFQQDYITDLTRQYPTQAVTLKGRGTVTHEVPFSLNGSIGFELKKLGFTIGGSVGNTYYYRKTVNLDFVARYH